jgi:predicted RNase H-like HicB family nuclease
MRIKDIFGVDHIGEGDTKEEATANAKEKLRAAIETRLQEDDDLD